MLSGYVQDITQACEALRVYVYGVLAAHLTGWDPKDLASYWAQSLSVHVQRSNTAILATRLPDGEAFIAGCRGSRVCPAGSDRVRLLLDGDKFVISLIIGIHL